MWLECHQPPSFSHTHLALSSEKPSAHSLLLLPSNQGLVCAKEQKQLPTRAKTASRVWACAMLLIGKRLEGCDKSRQAHQAEVGGSQATWYLCSIAFTSRLLQVLHSNHQYCHASRVAEGLNLTQDPDRQTGVQRPRAKMPSAVSEGSVFDVIYSLCSLAG